MVFNLAPSVSNRDLENIFGAYGEIKEVMPFFFFFSAVLFVVLVISQMVNVLCKF